MFLAIIAF